MSPERYEELMSCLYGACRGVEPPPSSGNVLERAILSCAMWLYRAGPSEALVELAVEVDAWLCRRLVLLAGPMGMSLEGKEPSVKHGTECS